MLGRRAEQLVLVVADVVGWTFALAAAALLRFEMDVGRTDLPALAGLIPFAAGGQLATGGLTRLYHRRHCVGSSEESVQLAGVVLLAGLLTCLANLALATPQPPRSVPLIATPLALLCGWAARLAIRRTQERTTRRECRHARRVIVLGAGRHGRQLARAMVADPGCGHLPVAFLDDDPNKRHLRSSGVAVRGTVRDLAEVAAHTRATLVMIAVPDAPEDLLREICAAAWAAGIAIKTAPRLAALLRPYGEPTLADLDLDGLLGRRQATTHTPDIAEHLAGRRVLVTGAGGSIGAELCRQIHRLGPRTLYMLDRDDSALHAVRLSIYGVAMLDSPDVLLADIRDPHALRRVFEECRPEVVFHAAALKHLPMLERFPLEAWKTNVLGTLNVLDAACAGGVRTFINISTDKAANPTSVLGRSKRVGERLVANAANTAGGTFLSVRFGNVLGSRGSVLTAFTRQLAGGGPVTVTHPEVTRFFMTISEAVHLVTQAATIGRSGEALVLDMGAPVRIVEMARRLMRLTGRPAPIVYTGLRPGEKLHEELFGQDEPHEPSPHPYISRLPVPPLDPTSLAEAVQAHGELAAMAECAAADPRRQLATSQEVTA